MRKILIGGAWPYANGSLHIGHIAGLLPGDVLARYHRLAGDEVYFVSGSDCHGTPVAIRAKKDGKTPQEVSDFYHEEFTGCFKQLGFSYDVYTKTSSEEHREFVQEFHQKLYESEYVYEKVTPQAYCEYCETFLADRFVVGKCPKCGQDARGDQCDACGTVLEPEHLKEPVCAVCGKPVSFRDSKHLYIAISRLEQELRELVGRHPEWRKNAVAFTNRYIEEGLRDRALTRDLDWGIPVPREGYEEKSIYIWAENVLGYLSASKAAARQKNGDFAALWGLKDTGAKSNTDQNAEQISKQKEEDSKTENIRHYYVHGKDNIPFHTIILPALLLANGSGWHLPDQIISSEYLTLEGSKISTSRNYAIWIQELLEKYEPDSIRYYFLTNGPEKKDADFSWREYVYSHNGELLGAYGNLINRSLTFIQKYWGGIIPEGTPDAEWKEKIDSLYKNIGTLIEAGRFKEALDTIFDVVREANKFFDAEQPWITRISDEAACKNTLYQCVQIIANLAVCLAPFLPFSSEKVCSWLGLNAEWKTQEVTSGLVLPEIAILFQRIDKKVIAEESGKLKKISQSCN